MAETRLMKPRSEAATLLQERIGDAMEIAPADAGDRELAIAERGEKRWRDYNSLLLRRMFTTDEYADEYARSVIEIHPVKDRYFDPHEDDIRGRLILSITRQLNCLASIRDRLDLIEDVTERDSHIRGMFHAEAVRDSIPASSATHQKMRTSLIASTPT
jgi:hypothetical protein